MSESSEARRNSAADPCVITIFGASGDLTMRKLLPAIYNLRKQGLLPDDFSVVGNARESIDRSEFRRRVRSALEARVNSKDLDQTVLSWVVDRCEYVGGDSTKDEVQAALRDKLGEIGKNIRGTRNVLFYLATPPALFLPITRALGRAGLLEERAAKGEAGVDHYWRRAIYEKPFGRDLESARELNRVLRQTMREDQIYRIDHYLGKETVQNMMVLRFANGIYEPIWNRRYIDSVQITVAESLGVEGRGNYYDSSGALRDMVPNHLFQLLSLIAMEPPNSFRADDVRDEKVKVLRAIKPLSHEDVLTEVVRGQYGGGRVGRTIVPGYRNEPKVKPDSETETYVAMRFEIDNWRWAGVPFYLRTGKRLAGRLTEIVIRFRRAPFQLFREAHVQALDSNLLVLQIQPEERIQMRFAAKVPGPGIVLGDALMDFDYVARFGSAPQTGYETLLYDCMKGDATLFQRNDQIETGWGIVTPIQDVWSALRAREFPNYAAGTWGPSAADELLARDSRRWTAINCCGPEEVGKEEAA